MRVLEAPQQLQCGGAWTASISRSGRLELAAAGPESARSIRLKSGAIGLANASDSFHQADRRQWTAAKVIEGDHSPNSGWAVNQRVNQPHSAVFEAAQAITASGGGTYIFTLEQKFPNAALGHFRISVTTDSRPVRALSGDVARHPCRSLPNSARRPRKTLSSRRSWLMRYRVRAERVQHREIEEGARRRKARRHGHHERAARRISGGRITFWSKGIS